MRIRLWLSVIVMLVWVVGVRATEPQGTLLDLLSSPDCVSSCWLGLDIGLPAAQMLEIFDANSILYEKRMIGGPDGIASYAITDEYTHPYVYPGASVFVFLDKENRVGTTFILLNDVFISDVMAVYGSPTHMLDERGNISLVYLRDGLVFEVASDGISIYQVDIQPEQRLIDAYITDEFTEAFIGCSEASPLCAVATATSMPEITATPIGLSQDAQALRDMLLPASCTQVCYFGIQPEITTRQEFETFLAENGIVPYVVSPEDPDNTHYQWDLLEQTVFKPQNGARSTVIFNKGKIGRITIALDIPVSVIYEAFGYPDTVTNYDERVITLIYKQKGMAVLLSRKSGHRRTLDIILASADSQYESFLIEPPGEPVNQTCSVYGTFPCIAPTATPMPK